MSVTKVPLTDLMWNVRGINAEKKQRYLHWFIGEQRPDIVMFNETKLTSKLFLNGHHSHQTLLRRAGGASPSPTSNTIAKLRRWVHT